LTMLEQQIADECRPHYDALTRYCINEKFF